MSWNHCCSANWDDSYFINWTDCEFAECSNMDGDKAFRDRKRKKRFGEDALKDKSQLYPTFRKPYFDGWSGIPG